MKKIIPFIIMIFLLSSIGFSLQSLCGNGICESGEPGICSNDCENNRLFFNVIPGRVFMNAFAGELIESEIIANTTDSTIYVRIMPFSSDISYKWSNVSKDFSDGSVKLTITTDVPDETTDGTYSFLVYIKRAQGSDIFERTVMYKVNVGGTLSENDYGTFLSVKMGRTYTFPNGTEIEIWLLVFLVIVIVLFLIWFVWWLLK